MAFNFKGVASLTVEPSVELVKAGPVQSIAELGEGVIAEAQAKFVAEGLGQKSAQVESIEEALVIEMLDLEKRIRTSEADKMIKRKEEIRKQLLGSEALADADPTLPFKFDADEGSIVFSACSNKVEIVSYASLLEAIGLPTFLNICSVSMTDLKKVLSETEIAKFTEKKQGSRTLKAVEPK